jgi:hypothetical protein
MAMSLCSNNNATFFSANIVIPPFSEHCYVSVIASCWFYIPDTSTLSYLYFTPIIFKNIYVSRGTLSHASNILRKMGKPYHNSIVNVTVIHFAASENKKRVQKV